MVKMSQSPLFAPTTLSIEIHGRPRVMRTVLGGATVQEPFFGVWKPKQQVLELGSHWILTLNLSDEWPWTSDPSPHTGRLLCTRPTSLMVSAEITRVSSVHLLWSPFVIGQTIYFHPVVSFLLLLLSSFFSSPNLSGRRSDVCHTSTHGVALVRI